MVRSPEGRAKGAKGLQERAAKPVTWHKACGTEFGRARNKKGYCFEPFLKRRRRRRRRRRKQKKTPSRNETSSTVVLLVLSTNPPSLSTVASGMPWQMTSFTDVQTLRGKPQ
jgi:hypothetical protein